MPVQPRLIAALCCAAIFLFSCSGNHSSNPGGVLPKSGATTPRHTMSGPSGISINNLYAADTAFVSSVTVPLNSPAAPNSGDLLVAIVYGYNSTTCETMTTPTGWTLHDSTCSTGTKKNTIWTFTKVASGSETSQQFSLTNGDCYFSAAVYDLGGASGVDSSSDNEFATSGTSQTTSSLTPSSSTPESGDLAISSFGNGSYNSDTISSPFTKDMQINNGVYLTVSHEALGDPSPTTSTATYTANPPDGGMSNLMLITAAPSTAPASARKWVPIHAYEGTGGGAGGGYDPGPAEDQALLYEVQALNFDPGSQTFEGGSVGSTADCPQNASCIPVGYVSPIYDYCDYSVPTGAYNAADANVESGFTHSSATISNTNRFVFNVANSGSGGYCPLNGQVSVSPGPGPDIQVFNFHDISDTTHSPYYYWKDQWPTIVNNESWKETMVDNFGYGVPYVSGVGVPYEYPSIADWRATITKWLVSLGYPVITNSLGPGNSNYVNNDAGGLTSFTGTPTAANGVVGWQVDVHDICTNIGPHPIYGLISEDPYAHVDRSTGIITYYSYNMKTLLNSVSHLWHDGGCPHTSVEVLNYASNGTSSNWYLRQYTKAAEFFMQSTDYDGQVGTPTIVEWRYSTCIWSCTNQLAVLPEDEIVFVPSTTKPLNKFAWGGHSDGNGCQVAGGTDTGGLVPFAQECGVAGQLDSGGYYTPVIVREGTCYQSGNMIGNCAAVIDTCYHTQDGSGNDLCPPISLGDLNFSHTYGHALTATGGDLVTDPNTGVVINPNESGETFSITGPKPPSLTGCGVNFQSQCAVILTP